MMMISPLKIPEDNKVASSGLLCHSKREEGCKIISMINLTIKETLTFNYDVLYGAVSAWPEQSLSLSTRTDAFGDDDDDDDDADHALAAYRQTRV